MKKYIAGILVLMLAFSSCKDYLDVVPDNVATLNMVFNSRVEAMKYLYTCYSYMPLNGNPAADPALLGGDEIWQSGDYRWYSNDIWHVAMGDLSANAMYGSQWNGLYQGLRDCNLFLDNVSTVPDLPAWERDQWIAEVKVLKAYYHFYLLRQFGPIPLIKTNIPVYASVNEVKVEREPVDSCFNYIVELLNESVENLPQKIDNPSEDLGRITQPIALSIKAKVLVTAASPLFNGNTDQKTLTNNDGTQLFNQMYVPAKWDSAMAACKVAIDACTNQGYKLFQYKPGNLSGTLTDTMMTQLSLRNAFTERWNSEVVWANTNSIAGGVQQACTPRLDPQWRESPSVGHCSMSAPLKMAKLFYTNHGVPIDEDAAWTSRNIYELRTAGTADQLYISKNTQSIQLHFDREPRFYADLGFDNGIWYGQGLYDDHNTLWVLNCKKGDVDQIGENEGTSLTGYFIKKFVHYQNVLSGLTNYSVTPYPWPLLRLSDLYLLYAESINEVEGPNGAHSEDLFNYIDLVRERAGLEGVKASWDKYTNYPKYSTADGMRKIIQQERLIELAFEGSRFWDIRRWKTAPDYYKEPLQGWNTQEYQLVDFYQVKTLMNQKFSTKNYFWPISMSDIECNRNLVQNIGW